MAEKPSIPSNKNLPALCFIALLACIGPCLQMLDLSWFHTNTHNNILNPSFIILIFSVLACTYFKLAHLHAFLIISLSLGLSNLHLNIDQRLLELLHFTFCFALVVCWLKLKLPTTLLFILFCADLSLNSQFLIFYNRDIPSITPITWNVRTHAINQVCMLVLPVLAFGFRKFKPHSHELG